jgi:hypothetical protein
MNQIPYTYCVLRYMHNPVAGETLNIGVLLYAPQARYAATLVEYQDTRLAHAFAGFDSENYQRTMQRFEAAIRRIRDSWTEMAPAPATLPTDAVALGSMVWADPDLSFRLGPVLAGVSADLEEVLAEIFREMVTSQYSPVGMETVRTQAEVAAVT